MKQKIILPLCMCPDMSQVGVPMLLEQAKAAAAAKLHVKPDAAQGCYGNQWSPERTCVSLHHPAFCCGKRGCCKICSIISAAFCCFFEIQNEYCSKKKVGHSPK